MGARAGAVVVALLAIAPGASAQTPIAAAGIQRAAASPLRWDVREAGHPVLGPIVFAMLRTPLATRVGRNAVSSNIYLSCERSAAKIAIELTNGTRPDDPGGLKAATMPRITCRTLVDGKPADEPLEATWSANELGDVMARGLWPSSLRACASLAIHEEVKLPAGWGAERARVEFEVPPYARELDSVFARCGEPTAYPVAEARPAAPPPPAAPRPAAPATPAAQEPQALQAPQAPAAGWITARVVSEGRTNVRAKPDLRAPLVIRLDPGDVVLVERSAGEWWHARSRPTARVPFEGYIRRDRLVVP